MNTYIADEYYRNPQLRARLFDRAHAERDRAIRAGLRWAYGRAQALFRICIGPLRGTERLV